MLVDLSSTHTACAMTCRMDNTATAIVQKAGTLQHTCFYGMQEVNGGEPLSVLTDNVRTAIMKNITRRMTPQPLKIRADIDMTCFAYDGVLHIQVIHLALVAFMVLFIPVAILLAAQSAMIECKMHLAMRAV
jgi:hypothetical protein